MKQTNKFRRAFTLVEALVVVAIVMILGTILVSAINGRSEPTDHQPVTISDF